MIPVIIAVAIVGAVLISLVAWRLSDWHADKLAWANLAAHQPANPAAFDPGMVGSLPEPARRFFLFAIPPGTPLHTVAELDMQGEFSLGSKAQPNYMPMEARQILAAPDGFVWKPRAGRTVWFTGSDGANAHLSWSRFWLWGLLPVARAGNTADHARAAFGRCVAEAVFWTPAALLPTAHVRWEGIDDSTARVTVNHAGLEQAVVVTVDAAGQLSKVVLQRWSDANPGHRYQLQPFGGYLSDYREFGGFRLPTRIEAGNFFETDDYFAFFIANVVSVRFPASLRDKPSALS